VAADQEGDGEREVQEEFCLNLQPSLQSTVAIRECGVEGRGVVMHKCQPTGEGDAAMWDLQPNTVGCVSPDLVMTEQHVSAAAHLLPRWCRTSSRCS
jgi:hypothetical protein